MTDYFYFDMENVIGVTSWLMESGEYYAKVTVCPQGEELIIGETPLQEYIAPSEQLPIPVNIAFDENGVLSFELVEGAVLYKVSVDGKTPEGDNVYLDLAGGAEYFTNEHSKDGKTITWSIEECIEGSRQNGEKGYYDRDTNFTVTIQAFSGDINTVRHSGISEGIVYEYIYFKSQDIALNDFNKALEDEDVEYAIDVLQKVNNEMLMEMLQTDADFAKEVKDLEIKYQNEHNITVTSKSEVEVVDASKVSIVGGVLNAPVDFRPSVVELSIKTPANAVEVPAKYSNGLPLDITLLIDENAQENLRVPVTITMPIPSGVSKEKLVILHYHANSTEPAVLTPVINADDTMTFIVDGFSTFVVANDISETSGDGNDSSNDTGNSDNNGNDSSDDTGNSDNNGNDNSNDTGSSDNNGNDSSDDTGSSDNNGNSNSNDNEGNSGDKSPDTGDNSVVFANIALGMAVALLVVYKKIRKA